LWQKGLILFLFDNCEFGEALHLIGKIGVLGNYRAHLNKVARSYKNIIQTIKNHIITRREQNNTHKAYRPTFE
jgi:cytochrome b